MITTLVDLDTYLDAYLATHPALYATLVVVGVVALLLTIGLLAWSPRVRGVHRR